ncbi:MAG: hypothetical protein Q7J03_04690 [Methanoregula sp.]|nr:hypothetical protein [Methanoregula sp.]
MEARTIHLPAVLFNVVILALIWLAEPGLMHDAFPRIPATAGALSDCCRERAQTFKTGVYLCISKEAQ